MDFISQFQKSKSQYKTFRSETVKLKGAVKLNSLVCDISKADSRYDLINNTLGYHLVWIVYSTDLICLYYKFVDFADIAKADQRYHGFCDVSNLILPYIFQIMPQQNQGKFVIL